MTKRTFKVLVGWDAAAQQYVTFVPALNYVSTHARTRAAAIERTKEAIVISLEGESEAAIARLAKLAQHEAVPEWAAFATDVVHIEVVA
jgi:predicted RNase H-like HicB family nuclease